MFTDLFVHQTTHMIAAMGVRFPARVVGGGGIFLEYDGRDVPDVATIIADYNEGCQLIVTATMINDYPIEEVIRGRLATLRFVNKKVGEREETDKDGKVVKRAIMEFGFEILPQSMKSGPGIPKRLENMEGKFTSGGLKGNDTEALWSHFLECVRKQDRETLCPPELGAAAFSTVNMGVQSYRQGKALYWDNMRQRVTDADATWAAKLEERSKKHDKPSQIMAWQGGDSGSIIEPPDYQKLGGPWIDGKDPARA
jgi:hypothetical protein